MPEINYARPTGTLSNEVSAEMAAVRAAFAAHGLPCRWEFLLDLFPTFPELLRRHGFPEAIARPLMVVTQETFRPEKSACAVVRKIESGETRAVDRVLNAAFRGEEAAANPEETDGDQSEPEPDLLAGMMSRGTSVYAAFVEGKPVAGGAHSPLGDTTEVAGVGTLAAFRRRGIAGALTSALVEDAFARGCTCVFLSAADESVQRVYARIGFEKIGTAMDSQS